MERYRKKDMLQTVETLLRANDAIVKTARSNPQGTAEALVQCQESAIALGTCLETFGETYAPLVQILEDYCENIYQMSESLSDESLCRKLSKKIQKQLTALQNGIKYDMPEDKKEIVFLPYKASMWDSLESVWKAADADPGCDAFVIPIPYYDKNPDGSFREEHYEGEQYPKYVPITRYDEYDLEARRPDVIYIHNPYDNCNHVTSVHPYFYSKNLRNFTDKLVYIPYFILEEVEPENETAVDSIKHFCFTPGTVYAHQVIVQSENMRQIYINEYMKAAKEMGFGGEHVDRKSLEKKFLGTGSPKIDKVLSTKKEDLEIPAEWLKIIEKPDGSWKKIIFYNTSVSALLQHDEEMLGKMESVFEIFKENQDEVALLWRPHPLIQATIESMRPELWEEYRKIRDRYVEEGWGIYDDSADMDRAVVVSDAYYGDKSSVVELYQKTGKLAMIQDIENIDFEEKIELTDALKIDEEIWLLPDYFSRLIILDTNTDRIVKYYDIPVKEGYGAVRSFSSMAFIDHKIYLIPFLEKRIVKFDMKTKSFTDIILDAKITGSQKELFWGKRVYGKYIFAMGASASVIIRLNTVDDSVEYITDWKHTIQNLTYKKELFFFGSQNVVLDGKLFVPFWNMDAVLEINCETLETTIHELKNMNSGYSGICYSEGFMWLIKRENGEVIKWNVERKEIRAVENSGMEDEKNYYLGMVKQDTRKNLLPRKKKGRLYYSEKEGLFDVEGAYSFLQEDSFTLRYYENISGILTMYDKQANETQEIEIYVDKSFLDIDRILNTKGIRLEENRDINLVDLLKV
ncbi:MAG: hypothetical protein K2K90_13265 [Lachnospiraceae bacterium]|nr:hypothetical protein [Lachnospiraceae bacterium]